MSRQPDPGTMDASVTFTQRQRTQPVEGEAVFRIAILADWGAGAGDAQPRLQRVDIDTLDTALAAMAPRVAIAPDPNQPELTFDIEPRELDDFHPDRLLKRVPTLAALDDLRRRLADPATFARAASELRSRLGDAPAAHPSADPGRDEGAPAAPGKSLSDLLGGDPGVSAPRAAPQAPGHADALIKAIVGRHVVDAPDPAQGAVLAGVERALADQLRRILHDPAFQRVESLWRALDVLLSSVEADHTLDIRLMHVTKEAFLLDLVGAADLDQSAIAQKLAAEAGDGWGCVVCAFEFGATKLDAAGLWRAGKLARRLNTACVAGGAPSLVGCASFADQPDPSAWTLQPDAESAQAWANLRRLPEAAHVCLVAPRFLARLPYAPDMEPIDAFAFTELPDPPAHEQFLWAPAAVLAAAALAQAFADNDAPAAVDAPVRFDAMPLVTLRVGGEPEQLPCAESWLTERAARVMEDAGLTPLLSVRRSDAVQLSALRAVSEQSTRLRGPWS